MELIPRSYHTTLQTELVRYKQIQDNVELINELFDKIDELSDVPWTLVWW
jgi:hypothetical protein